jgi:hypothetical protein
MNPQTEQQIRDNITQASVKADEVLGHLCEALSLAAKERHLVWAAQLLSQASRADAVRAELFNSKTTKPA